jgi:hypothetical protein
MMCDLFLSLASRGLAWEKQLELTGDGALGAHQFAILPPVESTYSPRPSARGAFLILGIVER